LEIIPVSLCDLSITELSLLATLPRQHSLTIKQDEKGIIQRKKPRT
jgi:hypothetical protein